jgi:hypothetical protein
MGRNKRSGRKKATTANQTAPAASQTAAGGKVEKKPPKFIVGLDFGTT